MTCPNGHFLRPARRFGSTTPSMASRHGQLVERHRNGPLIQVV